MHTLISDCPCQLCERNRFELRVTTIIVVALAVFAGAAWVVFL